jgi:hypothetical protein
MVLRTTDDMGGPVGRAPAHRFLAYAYAQCGRYADAHRQLEHALDVYVRAGDSTGQAHVHRLLAMLWSQMSRADKGLHHTRLAPDLYRSSDNRHGQA